MSFYLTHAIADRETSPFSHSIRTAVRTAFTIRLQSEALRLMQGSLTKSGGGPHLQAKKKPLIAINLLLFLACCRVLGSVAIAIHWPRSA